MEYSLSVNLGIDRLYKNIYHVSMFETTLLLLILVFVLGNLAGRIDAVKGIDHSECNKRLLVYYYALYGLCYSINADKAKELFDTYVQSSEEVLRKDGKL